jgi:hypothetical protein
LFQGIGGAGALLTGRPAHAASAVISTPAAIAEKTSDVMCVDLMKFLMANLSLLGFGIIEQPENERCISKKLARVQ